MRDCTQITQPFGNAVGVFSAAGFLNPTVDVVSRFGLPQVCMYVLSREICFQRFWSTCSCSNLFSVTLGVNIAINWSIFLCLAIHLWKFCFGERLGFKQCGFVLPMPNNLTCDFDSEKRRSFGGLSSFRSTLSFGLLSIPSWPLWWYVSPFKSYYSYFQSVVCCQFWRLPVRSTYIVLHFDCLAPFFAASVLANLNSREYLRSEGGHAFLPSRSRLPETVSRFLTGMIGDIR